MAELFSLMPARGLCDNVRVEIKPSSPRSFAAEIALLRRLGDRAPTPFAAPLTERAPRTRKSGSKPAGRQILQHSREVPEMGNKEIGRTKPPPPARPTAACPQELLHRRAFDH
jgi:hypothetical protein